MQRNGLKLKYQVLLSTLGIAIALASFYPSWGITVLAADLLGIDPEIALTEQRNFYSYIAVVLLGAVANALIVFSLFSYVIAKFNGWSAKQTIDYIIFVRDVPQHWLKDTP